MATAQHACADCSTAAGDLRAAAFPGLLPAAQAERASASASPARLAPASRSDTQADDSAEPGSLRSAAGSAGAACDAAKSHAVFSDGRLLVTYALPVRPGPTFDARAFELQLQRLARPDLEAAARKQCDLWAFVWASTSVLADILARVVSSYTIGTSQTAGLSAAKQRLKVLELGAGSGIASIAACRAGADVVATDLVVDALALIHANAAANGCATVGGDDAVSRPAASSAAVAEDSTLPGTLRCSVLNLESHDAIVSLVEAAGGFDMVVGADILFASWTVRPVLDTLAAALRASSTPERDPVAIIVDPGRTCRDDFEALAAEPQYSLHIVERVDIPALPTPVALMKECTVFVVCLARDGPTHSAVRHSGAHVETVEVAEAEADWRAGGTSASILDACAMLRARATSATAPHSFNAYGYVLAPVKP